MAERIPALIEMSILPLTPEKKAIRAFYTDCAAGNHNCNIIEDFDRILSVLSSTKIHRKVCILALLFAAPILVGCASSPILRPTPEDCITIKLWSNGWHASLALPADVFDEEHPLRVLFPDRRYFLIGWGARNYYMTEAPGFWAGLSAIIPPTKSVVHVIADNRPVEDSLWRPKVSIEFAVSKRGAIAMGERIAQSLSYDEFGEPIIISEGRVSGSSYFLAAKAGFHLFNMCNHWTARRLRNSGVALNAGISFTAPGLLSAVKRKMPAACPAK